MAIATNRARGILETTRDAAETSSAVTPPRFPRISGRGSSLSNGTQMLRPVLAGTIAATLLLALPCAAIRTADLTVRDAAYQGNEHGGAFAAQGGFSSRLRGLRLLPTVSFRFEQQFRYRDDPAAP